MGVIAVASLAGVALGTGLAELAGGDETVPSPASAPISRSSTTATVAGTSAQPKPSAAASSTTPSRTVDAQAAPVSPEAGGAFVDVEVLFARLSAPSRTRGHARVTARVRLINRGEAPVDLDLPVLISKGDEVPLDFAVREAASSLLGTLAVRQSTSGNLRFTAATDLTQRLLTAQIAQLRIAGQTVSLKLAAPPAAT